MLATSLVHRRIEVYDSDENQLVSWSVEDATAELPRAFGWTKLLEFVMHRTVDGIGVLATSRVASRRLCPDLQELNFALTGREMAHP